MYQDLYLSFPDEASAKAVLYRIEGAVEANEELGIEAVEGTEVANYANIDTIGVIYEAAPEPLPEDYTPVAIAGWHVNIRLAVGEDESPLLPYQVSPTTPMRVWG